MSLGGLFSILLAKMAEWQISSEKLSLQDVLQKIIEWKANLNSSQNTTCPEQLENNRFFHCPIFF